MKRPAGVGAGGSSSGAATERSIAHENPDQHAKLGPKPTPLPVNTDGIPDQLSSVPRWVVWRYEPNEKRDKWTKAPHRADGNGPASTTNPDTWAPFADGLTAYQAGGWDGIGFVVGEGIAGGDVDDCRDPETGELSDASRHIITTADTYAEVSPSGHGVRYFAFGTLPPKGRKRGPFELYDGDGGRFLTVTGHHIEGTPATLQERTDQLAAIHALYIAAPERRQPQRSSPQGLDVRHEDRNVLEAMWRSQNGADIKALWDGDTSAHGGDHSAADLALVSHLAWFTNYDEGQTDRLFRASGLMRPKWDEARGDVTYGQRTLGLAFEGHKPGDGYQGRKASRASGKRASVPHVAGPADPGEGGDGTDPWPDWQPVPDGVPRAPQIDADLLPHPLALWAFDLADRASITHDVMVPGVLVGLAIVTGNRWRIRPKRHDPWTVVPNLWGAIVQEPGQLKTYALASTLQPIRAIEAEMIERHERERYAREVDAEVARAQVDALTEAIRNHVKGKKVKGDASLDEIRAELIEAKRQAEQLDTRAPTLTVQDSTPERLLEIVADNPRGVGIVLDELYGLHQSLQKQGREDARTLYLTGHDGGQPYVQHRIKAGDRLVPILTLSILGGIQPSRLRVMQAGAIGGEDADGLLQRFQVLVWPDELPPFRLVDRPADHVLQDHVREIYRRIYDLDPARYGFGEGEPGIVHFAQDAQEMFYEWHSQLEHRLREPQMRSTPAWAQFLGKERGLMPSIALLLHLVDLVTGEATDVRVSLSAAQRAADIVTYLEGHAAKVYGPELARDHIAAQILADRIRDGALEGDDKVDGDAVRVKWLKDRNWSGLGPSSVDEALTVLERLGWLRVELQRTGGRPRKVVRFRRDLDDHIGEES